MTPVSAERPSGCEQIVVSRETWAQTRLKLLAFFTCSAALLTGCGYRAVYSEGTATPLCVVAASPRVPDFSAVQAALDGARAELARSGSLSPSGHYPCLVVEVLRVEERSTGVLAVEETPRARGSAVVVTGRGGIQAEPGAPLSRDTGDLRRGVALEAGTTLGAEAARHRAATEAAAHALGRDLARRALGLPVPSNPGF